MDRWVTHRHHNRAGNFWVSPADRQISRCSSPVWNCNLSWSKPAHHSPFQGRWDWCGCSPIFVWSFQKCVSRIARDRRWFPVACVIALCCCRICVDFLLLLWQIHFFQFLFCHRLWLCTGCAPDMTYTPMCCISYTDNGLRLGVVADFSTKVQSKNCTWTYHKTVIRSTEPAITPNRC